MFIKSFIELLGPNGGTKSAIHGVFLRRHLHHWMRSAVDRPIMGRCGM